jgi:hypothetical protein
MARSPKPSRGHLDIHKTGAGMARRVPKLWGAYAEPRSGCFCQPMGMDQHLGRQAGLDGSGQAIHMLHT